MADKTNVNSTTGAVLTKVSAAHLKRDGYLYIRQSTLHQVLQNTESTQRQYALREKAVSLGWPVERVHVIDCDLAHSGASAVDRAGFQQLVSEVSLGHAGLVLGLEVSRLARNSADWQRLLELCALTDTLILDEDGLYDCNDFNDRLLLGLKGTMSEAELHFLRARLRGGILSKARRGELTCSLPVGLVYSPSRQVQLDPDQQVQQAIRLLFETFRRTGSAYATMVRFHKEGWHFPRRIRSGLHQGDLVWGELSLSRALQVLHNPRYAGAFCFGRTRTRTWPDGEKRVQKLAMQDWLVLIPNLHVGYITWEEYQDNCKRLLECAQAHGTDRRKSLPREGPALLQGLVICGRCGRRMTIRYHLRKGELIPEYICQKEKIEHGAPQCQAIPGQAIDQAISRLLLETMTPISLEVAMAVQQEIVARQEEANTLRSQQVIRAQYQADLSGLRYRQVDPNNRLVANTLEAEWNAALQALQEVQQEYERYRQKEDLLINEEVRNRLMTLTTDFPRVWNDPRTTDHDRKRLLHLLLEDVTLLKTHQITLQIRFRGGATQTLALPAPQKIWKTWMASKETVQLIDTLLNEATDQQVAAILNERGLRTGKGNVYQSNIIKHIRLDYGLKSRFERLREMGKLTAQEMANLLGINKQTVERWRKAGLLHGYLGDDRGIYLFETPGPNIPAKCPGQKLSDRHQILEAKNIFDRAKEVQYES
jgi:DNA invertase Pin-like site-specific DNA recombinase